MPFAIEVTFVRQRKRNLFFQWQIRFCTFIHGDLTERHRKLSGWKVSPSKPSFVYHLAYSWLHRWLLTICLNNEFLRDAATPWRTFGHLMISVTITSISPQWWSGRLTIWQILLDIPVADLGIWRKLYDFLRHQSTTSQHVLVPKCAMLNVSSSVSNPLAAICKRDFSTPGRFGLAA